MPGRQSTGPKSLLKVRPQKQKRKRGLDAFAIAAEENNIVKVRAGRLGRLEGGLGPDDAGDNSISEDDDGENQQARPSKRPRNAYLRLGHEKDGNDDSDEEPWSTGQAPNDDDSSLNSDEAMDESDEEHFKGFAFRGSSSVKPRKRIQPPDGCRSQIDLDDEQGGFGGSDAESEGFAAEAVDMADVLDQQDDESDIGSEEDWYSSSQLSFSEEEETEPTPGALYGLQKFIRSLDKEANIEKTKPPIEMHEGLAVSASGVSTGTKPMRTNVLGKHSDPKIRKQLRSKRDELSVPLAKRQQDRIDRAAAYDKSKETLGRWIETVKQNRRAERLHFPLTDPGAAAAKNNFHMSVDSATEPINGLEAAIQKILEESGMAGQKGKSTDEQIQAFEELTTNKMPIDEVRKRRAQLRQTRELLFREEVRAKRIKKIKSKAWRRVHRKERERNAQRERDTRIEAGIEPEDEDEERLQRLRAEERVSGKHRSSRWAKGIKATRRGVWDEEARASMHEMARREEELKKRIEGRDPEADSLNSSESDTNTEESEDEAAGLSRRLKRLDSPQGSNDVPHARLHSLAFMQKADAVHKARNDEDIKRLRRELGGEPSSSSESDEDLPIGRRTFGPQPAQTDGEGVPETTGEFEERAELNDSDQDPLDPQVSTVMKRPVTTHQRSKRVPNEPAFDYANSSLKPKTHDSPVNPLIMASKPRSKRSATSTHVQISADLPLPISSRKGVSLPQTLRGDETKEIPSKLPAPSDFRSVDIHRSDDTSGSEPDTPSPSTNQAQMRQTFGADDGQVAEDFAAEKAALAAEEAAVATGPVEEGRMPGWGSWVGEGISSAPRRPPRSALRSGQGNAVPRRRDIAVATAAHPATEHADHDHAATANPRVIVSGKTVKANAPYRATQLPFPFETQAQYERALRLPVGQEWVTRHTFLDGTTPRVNVKKGEIIRPMRKPLA